MLKGVNTQRQHAYTHLWDEFPGRVHPNLTGVTTGRRTKTTEIGGVSENNSDESLPLRADALRGVRLHLFPVLFLFEN